MKIVFSTILFAVLSTTSVSFAQKQYPCIHPGGGAGNCVSIYDCPVVMDVAKKDAWLQEEVEFLTKVQCGYRENKPTVCCPKTCTTANSVRGVCLTKYSCPSSVVGMNSSDGLGTACEGSEQDILCCGETTDVTLSNLIGIHHECKYEETTLPPDGRTRCCGLGKPGINYGVGYEDASAIGQHPWMALLEYQRRTGGVFVLCGGGLISAKFVLTAAHCLIGPILEYSEPKMVRLGEFLQSNEGPDCMNVNGKRDCTSGAIRITVRRYQPHQNYDNPDRINDIGIVELQRSVTFNEFIRPICLPNSDITTNQTPDLKVTVVGWGQVGPNYAASVFSRYVEIPIVGEQVCKENYEKLAPGQICIGGEIGRVLCGGESAMPIFFKRGNTYEYFAIQSFVPSPCGVSNTPIMVTEIFHYRDWIDSTVANLTNLG